MNPLHDSEADTLFGVSINSHIAAPPLGSDEWTLGPLHEAARSFPEEIAAAPAITR